MKALDLSHNMIGDKETYNFVRPDYTTGGEAVAEMIEVCRCLSLCKRDAYTRNPNPTCTICCDRVDSAPPPFRTPVSFCCLGLKS